MPLLLAAPDSLPFRKAVPSTHRWMASLGRIAIQEQGIPYFPSFMAIPYMWQLALRVPFSLLLTGQPGRSGTQVRQQNWVPSPMVIPDSLLWVIAVPSSLRGTGSTGHLGAQE